MTVFHIASEGDISKRGKPGLSLFSTLYKWIRAKCAVFTAAFAGKKPL